MQFLTIRMLSGMLPSQENCPAEEDPGVWAESPGEGGQGTPGQHGISYMWAKIEWGLDTYETLSTLSTYHSSHWIILIIHHIEKEEEEKKILIIFYFSIS